MIRIVLIAVLCVLTAGAAGCGAPPEPAPPPRPDVVLIVLDALRSDRLSLYGYGRKTTPNLDAARSRLRVFTNVTTPAPQTAPTMASVFTGVPPRVHGLQFDSVNHVFMVDGVRVHTPKVADRFTTLAQRFKGAGYVTWAASTNPWIAADWGYARGFDSFVGWKVVDPVLPPDGRRLLTRLDAWLDQAPNAPRFIYAHFMDVHAPFEKGHVDFVERPGKEVLINGKKPVTPRNLQYMKDLYDSNILYADRLVADLFARLDAGGRPYVAAIMGDHGDEFMEHGGLGHGTTLYDELLRVPLIFRGPAIDRFGASSYPLELTDLHDMLLAAAGLAKDPLLGLISSSTPEPAPPDLVRASEAATVAALRHGTWKYIVNTDNFVEELYDLGTDPGERTNVAGRETAVIGRFREEAAALWPKRFLGAATPWPNADADAPR